MASRLLGFVVLVYSIIIQVQPESNYSFLVLKLLMQMDKVFNDLESLVPQEQEYAKRDLADCFASGEWNLYFLFFPS